MPLTPNISDLPLDLAKSAGQGAELLDTAVPGWHRVVHVATLDLGDPHRCVLGQLFGDYMSGVRALRIPIIEDVTLGFDMRIEEPAERIAALTQAWLAEINSRRAADRAEQPCH